MPICNHQLTHEQLTHVKELARRCQQRDGNTIPIYSNLLLQHRNLPCNLLYYQQQQLIGFLSLFFFYDDACEITLMVDPAWRRNHISQRLISTILPIVHSRELNYIFFPSPQKLNNDWLPSKGLIYHHNEVQMQWMRKRAPAFNRPDVDVFQAVVDEYIPILAAIDNACFHTEKSEMEQRYHRLLRDDTYTLLIMKLNHKVIGKAHLHQEIDHIQLSDIAILPSYQGQGLGQALVAQCVHQALALHNLPLRLEVESTNHNALHIYQKLGFKTINAWDFWKMPIILQKANDLP